jgi:hypothetical protein
MGYISAGTLRGHAKYPGKTDIGRALIELAKRERD